jgi:hypothetical protein
MAVEIIRMTRIATLKNNATDDMAKVSTDVDIRADIVGTLLKLAIEGERVVVVAVSVASFEATALFPAVTVSGVKEVSKGLLARC